MIKVPATPMVGGGITTENRGEVFKRGNLRPGGATGTRIGGNSLSTSGGVLFFFFERTIGDPDSFTCDSLLIRLPLASLLNVSSLIGWTLGCVTSSNSLINASYCLYTAKSAFTSKSK